jgi:hypothetical protein
MSLSSASWWRRRRFIILRKLVRRIYAIARRRSSPAAHASWKPCRRRFRASASSRPTRSKSTCASGSITTSSRSRTKPTRWARVAHRASPMMEALGGFAIAGALIYGGYRVLETGATPGEFFSFLTAFMLAYEPAKRLGAAQHRPQHRTGRRAHPVRNHRQPADRAQRRSTSRSWRRRRAAGAERDVRGRLSRGRAGAARHDVRGRAGQADRAGRPVGRRQVDGVQSDPAVLRADGGAIVIDGQNIADVSRRSLRNRSPMSGRTCSCSTARSATTSPPASRRERRRDRRRRQGRACARVHQRFPGLRHAGRRARRCSCRAASASASPSRAR